MTDSRLSRLDLSAWICPALALLLLIAGLPQEAAATHGGSPPWGPRFVNPTGPNQDHPFCTTMVDLFRGEADLSNLVNDFDGHVRSMELMQAALPAGAPSSIDDDFQLNIDILAAARDATPATGLSAFDGLGNPEMAGAQGRIVEYIGDFCGFTFGDPSYVVDSPTGPITACPGWPRAGSPLTNDRFPNALDTSAANYFLNFFNHGGFAIPPGTPGFIDVPFGGRVEFQGEYANARYFGFHPSDVATNNFLTIRDDRLAPDPGSTNPWLEETQPGEVNTFTATYDFNPNPPAGPPPPNTSYVGRIAEGGGVPAPGNGIPGTVNPVVFNLLRNYGGFLGPLPPNFTGVELPAITVYDAGGNQTAHFPACEPYPAGWQFQVDATRFPSLPIADHRASDPDRVGKLRRSWQFGSPVDLITNADVFYTTTAFSKLLGNVMVQRAKKPTVSAPDANPRSDPDAQARMFTACIYNFWAGRANDCKADTDIVTDRHGFYTLVVSEAQDRPHNATAENGYTWFDWGPFLDGSLSMRNLMVDDEFWENMAEAIETGSVPAGFDRRFVPKAAHCPRFTFELGGHRACFWWDRRFND